MEMKQWPLIIPTILVLLPGILLSFELSPGITKHNFWIVDLSQTEKASVQVGDMVLVKPPTYPLIPANLKKTFAVGFDRQRLRLVAEEPPETEGRMGKRYYFVVLQAGATEVRFIVKQEEREVETFKLSILVEQESNKKGGT
jgi:hypothetical protein